MSIRAAAFAFVVGMVAPAFVVGFAVPASANGVISEFPAGGVVFKEAANIAIAREDLYLSPREIKVHYVYRSDAKDIETHTIGFPMPKVPLDGGPDYLGGTDPEALGDMRNYMDFKVSVNGKPLEAKLHEFAWLDGVDVSDRLKAAGIPLIVSLEEGQPELATVDRKVIDDLVAQGLFRTYEDSEYLEPAWLYQTVYEWQQDFARGKTEVEISYVPLNGYPSDIGGMYEGGKEYDDPLYVKQATEQYCIDDSVIRAIRRHEDRGSYEVVTQGYVTTTGNYWKGQIEEFNLIVDKHDTGEGMEDLDLVAFCPLDARKINATQFRWTAKDFEPTRDISVVYYDFYDIEQ